MEGKLVVSIMLLMIPPLSLLVFVHKLVAGPLIEEVDDLEPDEGLLRIQKNVGVVLVLEAAFLLTFSIVSLLTVAIYSYVVSCVGRSVSLKESSRISTTWKRLVITWLYVMLFTVAYMLLLVVSIVALALVTRVDSMVTWIGLVRLLAAVFYLYLASLSMLGLVISFAEDDCYGMKALEKAGDLIRGRKVQGFVLMLFLVLLSGPISILFYLNASDDEIGAMAQFAFGSVVTLLFCITKLFTIVVYTVFYYECKKIHGENIELELGTGYSNLNVHSSLP